MKTQYFIDKGLRYYKKKEYQKAIKAYKSVPNSSIINFKNDVKAIYYFNIAIAYLSISDYKNARKYFDLTKECNPNPELYREGSAVCSFGEGDLIKGFEGYKYRYYKPHAGPGNFPKHNFIMTLDIFKQMKDKNILVNSEQGLGDDIMFSLSFKYLSENVKSATIITRKSLKPLFEAIYQFDNITFIDESPELGDENFNEFFDKFYYWTVTGDVFTYEFLETGKFSGLQDPEVIKNKILSAESDTFTEFNSSTESNSKADISTDDNSKFNENTRSNIGITCFPLPDGITAKEKLVSWKYFKKFQKDQNLYLVQKLLPEHNKFNKGSTIPCIIDDNFNFLDTAKVILKMDKVYSIDTAVAHLTGLLGVDLYVVINKYFDWRWKDAKLYHPNKVSTIMLNDFRKLSVL